MSSRLTKDTLHTHKVTFRETEAFTTVPTGPDYAYSLDRAKRLQFKPKFIAGEF